MGLSKHRLGKYIERVECRNVDLQFGIEDVRGISNTKEIQPTKADVSTRSFERFQIVKPHEFAFNRRTTRMGDKIGLGYNTTGESFIVTEDYVVFKVADETVLLPDYLYIFFRRPEFDRYARWNSWGSATEFFNWEEMCEVPITLPPIQVQQKYVNVYNAMAENQKSYETGLEDLKLTCDAYIERLRRHMPCEKIGPFLSPCNEKNDNLNISLAQGVSVDCVFTEPKRVADDQRTGKIVRNGQFAFNKVMKAHNTKLPIALRDGPDCFVSGSYQVFEVVRKDKLLPKYLMLWLSRTETQRYAGFISFGTTRDIFDYCDLCEISIPIPSIEIQQDIADIFDVYNERKAINEQLRAQLVNMCYVLIKGSVEEARR